MNRSIEPNRILARPMTYRRSDVELCTANGNDMRTNCCSTQTKLFRRCRDTFRTKRARRDRRGAIYILTIGTALIVGLLAMGALFAVRIQRRQVSELADSIEARLYARAAIDMALYRIDIDSDWRNSVDAGAWSGTPAIGAGTYEIIAVDPGDGDIIDLNTDPVAITATGTKGLARQKMSVQLVAVQEPLDALSFALRSDGELHVMGGKLLRAIAGPVATNDNLRLDGTIDANVEAVTQSGAGSVTGTLTVPTEVNDMPEPSVLALYVGKATSLPYSGDLDGDVLSPGYNSYGGLTNAEGVYHLVVGGADLRIQKTRVHGTLVIQAPGQKVIFDNEVFLQNYESNYPAMIVQADTVEIMISSATSDLSESDAGSNFNPAGAAYQGASDSDQQDVYPNEISGLIHVIGNVVFKQSPLIRGAIIAEGRVTVDDQVEIIYDPTLAQAPPEGYVSPPEMKVSPGTWQKLVD